MLPVSSSGHLALVPRLLGWSVAELDPATRKTLEVALHAGSAGALAVLAWRQRGAPRSRVPHDPPARAAALVLTVLPPAAAGLLLERPIERRLGGPRAVASAQVVAGIALWLADRRGARRTEPDVADYVAVGFAQALALAPGVSRSGAALTATRLLGLARPAAVRLSFRAALPVTLGAAALKGTRALRGELDPRLRAPLAAGALAALATGLACTGLAVRLERSRSLAPLAAYRVGLGLSALARTRHRT